MGVVLGLAALVVLTGLVFALGRVHALAWFLAFLTYKSTVVAFFSCDIDDLALFRVLQAIDFLFAVLLVAYIVLLSAPTRERLLRLSSPTARNLFVIAVLVLLWVLYGFARNPPDAVAVYVRMLFYPVLMYIIGVWLSLRMDLRQVATVALFVLLPAAFMLVAEFAFRDDYHAFMNSACYQSLKYGRSSGFFRAEDILAFSKVRLFNLEIFSHVVVVKPFGATFNYPSTSYLMVFAVLCAVLVQRWLLALLFLAALALITTKASGYMLLTLLAVPLLARRLPGNLVKPFCWAWVLLYGAAATAFLLTSKNIHAWSVMASIQSLPAHILGNGVGWGGALTFQASYSWDEEMLVGDSGLAILLNMMGIVGALVFLLYLRLFSDPVSWRVQGRSDRDALLVGAFGLGVVGNAVLQELAVGPYAAGLALLLLALLPRGAQPEQRPARAAGRGVP